jgi:hypothetical protein
VALDGSFRQAGASASCCLPFAVLKQSSTVGYAEAKASIFVHRCWRAVDLPVNATCIGVVSSATVTGWERLEEVRRSSVVVEEGKG